MRAEGCSGFVRFLINFLEAKRGRFDEVEAEYIVKCVCTEYHITVARLRERSKRNYNSAQEGVTLTGRDKFKVETYLAIIDKLISCLKSRISAYDEVHTKFQVLSDFKTLPFDDIRAMANVFADTYPGDLDKTVFADEVIQLVEYAKAKECDSSGNITQLLHIDQLDDTFPNVCRVTDIPESHGFKLLWRTVN